MSLGGAEDGMPAFVYLILLGGLAGGVKHFHRNIEDDFSGYELRYEYYYLCNVGTIEDPFSLQQPASHGNKHARDLYIEHACKGSVYGNMHVLYIL